jgi:hypothetical protein
MVFENDFIYINDPFFFFFFFFFYSIIYYPILDQADEPVCHFAAGPVRLD